MLRQTRSDGKAGKTVVGKARLGRSMKNARYRLGRRLANPIRDRGSYCCTKVRNNWLSANTTYSRSGHEVHAYLLQLWRFLRIVQHVDPGTSGCDQLISVPNSLAKNTSRSSYNWDIIRGSPSNSGLPYTATLKMSLRHLQKSRLR